LKSDLLGGIDERIELLMSLLKEDDWSFVIKAHALIEAVVTEAIISHVNEPKLLVSIERIPLSDDQYGKLTIAKDLGLLTKEQRRFIRRISKLRNDLAHKISNISFTFESYINNMDSQGKNSWSETVVWFRDESAGWKEASKVNPKLAVWMGVFLISTVTLTENMEREGMRKINELAEATTKELLAGNP
jgi:hypothetical protein